jgi:hypothetical protein
MYVRMLGKQHRENKGDPNSGGAEELVKAQLLLALTIRIKCHRSQYRDATETIAGAISPLNAEGIALLVSSGPRGFWWGIWVAVSSVASAWPWYLALVSRYGNLARPRALTRLVELNRGLPARGLVGHFAAIALRQRAVAP